MRKFFKSIKKIMPKVESVSAVLALSLVVVATIPAAISIIANGVNNWGL